jgi:hypothetical protein
MLMVTLVTVVLPLPAFTSAAAQASCATAAIAGESHPKTSRTAAVRDFHIG